MTAETIPPSETCYGDLYDKGESLLSERTDVPTTGALQANAHLHSHLHPLLHFLVSELYNLILDSSSQHKASLI